MYQIWKTVMMIIIQQKFEKNKKLTLKPNLTKYNNACLVTNNALPVTICPPVSPFIEEDVLSFI